MLSDKLSIAMMDPADVKPYDKNPRYNDQAVDAVARSIEQFGFLQPVVVDANMVIVVGHTRWKAANHLGLKSIPVHVAKNLTDDKAKAYRLADNKLSELADWNMDTLALELAELKAADFDITHLGFSDDNLTEIFAPKPTDGVADPDDVPLPPETPVTQVGDIWVLGNHRLMCGDSSNPADLDRLLAGDVIHLVNTDPPYNVKVESRSNNSIANGTSSFGPAAKADGAKPAKGKPKQMRAKDRPLANDFVTDAEFDRLLAAWFGNITRVLVPGGGFYIWGGYCNCGNYPPVMKAQGLYFSQAIIWVKEHPVLSRKDFMGNHEWCFYGWKEGAAHRFLGPNNVTDVWSVKKVNQSQMVHLTEKPVELAKRAMEYSSKPGENVLDLFGGSGSTLIAAEVTGRRARLMEIDQAYCDVIVGRWEKFTGKKAELLKS